MRCWIVRSDLFEYDSDVVRAESIESGMILWKETYPSYAMGAEENTTWQEIDLDESGVTYV